MKPILLILFALSPLFASGADESSHTHHMMLLVLQVGIILFSAHLGGIVFKKLSLPSVLGELIVGMLIGPYLLGSIAFPGFAEGLFPLQLGGGLPVSIELYGIATIASVILLFMAGLETDLKLFLRFSFTGSVVGIGGVVVSFIIGSFTTLFFLPDAHGFMDPRVLFMGVMSTATSVGITVRILSEKKKLDSPEGVTILAGAVIDDILGIILLAIVVGISSIEGSAHSTNWGAIGGIAFKAISVWLIFTVLGILFADYIAKFLKYNKTLKTTSILSLGLALIVAGIFEQAGLAMIIGAYVLGLSLSKTELNLSIQENLEPLSSFFVPIFFTTMGMLVDVREIFNPAVLLFGSVYTLGAIAAKMIGSGIPALFLNFNARGAMRIGMGMIPRGEVALIIAGIGLSSHILDQQLFSVAVLMTLITTLIAPILLSIMLSSSVKGTRKDVVISETGTLSYPFPSSELTDLVENKVLKGFTNEGFMLHRLDGDSNLYHIQKDKILILFTRKEKALYFDSAIEDQMYVKSLLYEMLIELTVVVEKVKQMVHPEEMKKSIVDTTTDLTGKSNNSFAHLFQPQCITMHLHATTKEGAINELLQIMQENGIITNLEEAKSIVLERESVMSTGMQNGVAIPHGRMDQVDQLHVVIGFSQEGIDFNSMDGAKSRVILLTIIPNKHKVPYVQFLSSISTAMQTKEQVEKLLTLQSRQEVIQFFC